jgi:hypothetical protein
MSQAATAQISTSVLFALVTAFCTILWRVKATGGWFAPVAAICCGFASIAFGASAFFGFSSWQTQVLGSLLRELPYYVLLSSICLAQAGWRPTRRGLSRATVPAHVMARPRLRRALTTAPAVLLASWFVLGVLQFIWPSPALQLFAPAPPRFLLFSLLTSAPDGFYTALITYTFLLAAGPAAPTRYLRLKNLLFSMGASAWFLMLVNANVYAAERVSLPRALLQVTTGPHLALEKTFLIASAVAFAIGLVVPRAPKENPVLARWVYPRLLSLQEAFEEARWHIVKGNKLRNLVRGSYYATHAARSLRFASGDTELLHTTIQLTAILSSQADRARVTPERARELLDLQAKVLKGQAVLEGTPQSKEWVSELPDKDQLPAPPLHLALNASMDFTDRNTQRENLHGSERPLWYYLAAVVVDDLGYSDPTAIRSVREQHTDYNRAQAAYTSAKDSARLLTATKN